MIEILYHLPHMEALTPESVKRAIALIPFNGQCKIKDLSAKHKRDLIWGDIGDPPIETGHEIQWSARCHLQVVGLDSREDFDRLLALRTLDDGSELNAPWYFGPHGALAVDAIITTGWNPANENWSESCPTKSSSPSIKTSGSAKRGKSPGIARKTSRTSKG